ncbi:unnamed protein product [marine sediment metagenome]|uniref:Uncharacterized protein n=1 Tax=marine sediment metagenome TaxID=412755 RepID=X1W2K1_9ZZZZ
MEELPKIEVQLDPHNYQYHSPVVFGHHRLYPWLSEKEEGKQAEVGGMGEGG